MMTATGDKLKVFAKRVIWNFTRHEPGGEPDIILASSRRCGSTWLMETIAAADGLRYLDQPFSNRNRHASRTVNVPSTRNGHIVCPGNDILEEVASVLELLIAGRLAINAPWDFRKLTFHRHTDRLVLKLLAAKDILPWMDDRFNVRIIYSLRHPIPASLSCMKNDFRLTADAYLYSEEYRSKHITSDQASQSERILHGDDQLAKFVLNWVLENLSMLRTLSERRDWLFVPYESFVLHTEEIIRQLAAELSLSGVENMLAQAGLPSRSTRSLQSTLERDEQATERLAKWRMQISEPHEERLMRILEMFDIDLYRVGSDVAHYDDRRSSTA